MSHDVPPPSAAAVTSKPRAKRRWRRKVALLLIAILAGGVWYLTRPATLARMILPALSRSLGGAVSAKNIELKGFEQIVLEDIHVHVRGWQGPAAEIAWANRITVRFSLAALFTGKLDVRSVDVGTLNLRVAERLDQPGEFSVLALEPEVAAPTSPSSDAFATQITVDELIIENGVTLSANYRKVGDLRFRGALAPIPGTLDTVAFRLTGRPDADGKLSVGFIDGRFDARTRAISLEVDEINVEHGELAIGPVAVRAWVQQLAIEGKIAHATLEYAPGTEPTATLDVEGVGMDIPVALMGSGSLREQWSGYADGKEVPVRATPRMKVDGGSLRLIGDTIRLDGAHGTLGARDATLKVIDVPFECNFKIDLPRAQLPAFEWEKRASWFESAALIAPFTMEFAIRDFRSPAPTPGETPALQLPRPVTKILADFNITSWTIDIETRFERGAPAADGAAPLHSVPAPLHSTGSLRISGGSAAYEEFMYRVDDVTGVISFDNDTLLVERITGKGADNATVLIEGKLEGLSTGAEIDLRISCPDAPIDDRLFASFDEGPREALSLLFDPVCAEGLRAAGMLPDETWMVGQRRELALLSEGSHNDDDRARLQKSLTAGPFALGGRAGFDLRVYSPAGFGEPVLVTGNVNVRDAGIVFGRFPYPLRLKAGEINLLDEAVIIGGDGLHAITPAGGEFIVSGSVRIPRDGHGGRSMRPLIEISDSNDAVNPALLAAIPHDDDAQTIGWPGKTLAPAGELLQALGLTGRIELNGLVTSKESGEEDFRVRLALTDGVAAPDTNGLAWLAANGLPWPAEFTLEQCSAHLDIVPERVTFDSCTGRHGTGSVVAQGFAALNGPDRVVEINLNALPIGRAFEGYLAGDAEAAAAQFRKFGPSGAIDGTIRREVTAAGEHTTGSLTPQYIEVTLDGSRVRADRIAGRVSVTESALRAENLQFRLTDGNQDDGVIRLAGPLSPGATNSSTQLEASITGGRFESPLLREALSQRAPAAIALLRTFNAKGLYDARFVRGVSETFDMTPRSMSIGAVDERIALDFTNSDRVHADDDSVELDVNPAMDGAASGRINLNATVDTRSGTTVVAKLGIDASALTPALRAQLPPPLADSAAGMDLVSAGAFSLKLDEVSAHWNADASSSAEPQRYTMRGTAHLNNASFNAGVNIRAVDATIPLTLRYEPFAAETTEFHATVSTTTATVFDRVFGAGTITLDANPQGTALTIAGAGDLAQGRFDLASTLDLDEDAYTMRLRVADASFEGLTRPGGPPASGNLTALLQLHGAMSGDDTAAQRTGSGRVSVRDATLASMPVAMQVLRLTQLMLPGSSALTGSEAQFTILNDTLSFFDLKLASGSLRLTGDGSLDLPTLRVAARLNARGTVPLFSDLIGSLTGQIFAIDVRGTLLKPEVSIAPLPGLFSRPTIAPPQTSRLPAERPTNSTAPHARTPIVPLAHSTRMPSIDPANDARTISSPQSTRTDLR